MSYTLLFGVKVSLERKLIERNPNFDGEKKRDAKNPYYILSKEDIKRYHAGLKFEREAIERDMALDYVLPNGEIVENLVDSEEFVWDMDSDGKRLSFIEHDGCDGTDQCPIGDSYICKWPEKGKQLLGIVLLYDNPGQGYVSFQEQRILEVLAKKEKIAEMINAHGFDFKPEDISLHRAYM